MAQVHDPSLAATPPQGASRSLGQVIQEEIIPLVEETLEVRKRTVETGTVRVRTVVQQREEIAKADIFRHAVSVDRVPIDREIDEIPAPWEEGDVLVVPVVEEIMVVEKRLILREELRIHRRRDVEHVEQRVPLRSMEGLVERQAISTGSNGEKKPG